MSSKQKNNTKPSHVGVIIPILYRKLRPQMPNHPIQAWNLDTQAWLELDMNESRSVPFGVRSQTLFTMRHCLQLKEVGQIQETSAIMLLFSHKSWLTLCNPTDCSMPGSSVLHCLLEFAQIYVHCH